MDGAAGQAKEHERIIGIRTVGDGDLHGDGLVFHRSGQNRDRGNAERRYKHA
jgi:hypothetical protein